LYITGTASDHEIFVQSGVLKAANDDKMGEGCVTVTWIQFNLSLLQITGETKYAEEIERSVYNHLLAAENPQTGCVSYYTAHCRVSSLIAAIRVILVVCRAYRAGYR
jgi:DUF1680 family protein